MYSLRRPVAIKLWEYFLLIDCSFKNSLVTFVKWFSLSLTSCHFTIAGLIQNQLLHFCSYFIPFLREKFEGYRLKNHGAVSKIVIIPDLTCTVVKITLINDCKLRCYLRTNSQKTNRKEITILYKVNSHLVHHLYCISLNQHQ